MLKQDSADLFIQVGRDDELAIIKNVIRNTATSFSRQFYVSGEDSRYCNIQNQNTDILIGTSSRSTRSGSPDPSWDAIECSSKLPSSGSSGGKSPAFNSLSPTSGNVQADGRNNGLLHRRTSAIFVTGPSGLDYISQHEKR